QVLCASRGPGRCGTNRLFDDTPADVPAFVKVLADNEYSGEDIERILRAVSSDPLGRNVHGTDPAAQALFREKAATVKNMIENEMSVEDIERVLRTYPQGAKQGAPTPA